MAKLLFLAALLSVLKISASFIATTPISRTQTYHYAAPNNQTDAFDWFDTTTIVPDLLGIVVAFEFLGIVDDINAPDFVQKGGWMAPITVQDLDTLPVLVNKVCTNAIMWLLALVSTEKAVWNFLIYCLIHAVVSLALSGNVDNFVEQNLAPTLVECYFTGLFVWASRYFLAGRI